MRILFLTHRLPYAPNRGDRIRSFHVLRELATFASVDVVSFVHSREEASHARDLSGVTSSVRTVELSRLRNLVRAGIRLPTPTPVTHTLLDAPSMNTALLETVEQRRPDVVLAFCSGMARFAIQAPLAGLPFFVDMVDVDSVKWRELAGRSSPPMQWIYRREAKRLSQFETAVSTCAHASVVVNQRERAALAALAPGARIEVVENGIDLASIAPPAPPAESFDIVFCGVMDYVPNEEAAIWLCKRVWPLVRRHNRRGRIKILGASPTARVRALADPGQAIEVTGSVPDVRPHLWTAALSVAPLFTARGTQNKVLEAVGAGLPAVVTSQVAEGLPTAVRAACTVADSAETFAAAILQHLALSPRDRRSVADRADLSGLSWARQLKPFRALIESATTQAIGSTR